MSSQVSYSINAASSRLLSVTVSVTVMTALVWLYQYHYHSSSHVFIAKKKNKKGQSSPKEDPSASSISGARSSTPSSTSSKPTQEVPLQQQEGAATSEDDNDEEDGDEESLYLPQHLEREFYKDQRRRQMIPFLTMKKTMYDNIGMLDPNGHHLCNISMKKANWYINKNIATWTDESTKKDCIQLSFHPKMAANSKDPGLATYNRGQKVNQCVVCGAQRDYMRHYIVPYCYRSLFPIHFKTHMPHDVVLLCAETCHARADSKSHKRMMRMENKLRFDPETEHPQIIDRQLQKVQSAAQALLKWKDRIPADRILEYQKLVVDYFQLDSIDALTQQHLMQASQIEARRPNPKYIPGPNLIIDVLLKSDTSTPNSDSSDLRIAQFVRDWRRHFLQTMQPKFLPVGWSVDSPVQCDDRGSSKDFN